MNQTHDTAAAVAFLQRLGHEPTLTAVHVDEQTGKKGLVESKSFSGPRVWDAVRKWVDERQRRANIYYSLNPLLVAQDKKSKRTDVAAVAYLHVDADARVGESPEECVARVRKRLASYDKPPTFVVESGGGLQIVWRLQEPIQIDGDLGRAEDAKLFNVQLERDFEGDHCHNIDRIMRLPGTWNCPHDKKREKGRQYAVARLAEVDWDRTYPLSAFRKAVAVQERATGSAAEAALPAARVSLSGNRERMAPDDPRLAKIPGKWRVMAFEGDAEGRYGGDRSRAAFAFVCEAVRAEVEDDAIANVLCDPDWWVGRYVREKKNIEREVERLISRAREHAIDPDLSAYNAKHFVTNVNGKIVVCTVSESEAFPGRKEYTYSSFEDFRKMYSNVKKTITYKTSAGVDTEVVAVAEWWLNHPMRRQFLGGMRFMPYRDGEVVGERLNLWKGLSRVPRDGDCDLFLAHVRDNICGGDEACFEYLMNWMAHAVQRRDQQGHVAVCLRGDEGVGKGFFAKTFGALFGEHFLHVTNPDHLTGKFNSHLETCYVLFADECFYAGDRRHEQILKVLVTEETFMIEPKGVNAYSARNFLHIIMSTNADWIVPAGPTARRWFVLDVGDAKRRDSAYFEAIRRQMESGGYEALLDALLRRDLSGFQVREFPETEALARQKAHSLRGVDELIQNVAFSGALPWPHSTCHNVAVYTGFKRGEGFWCWARDNFRDLQFQSLTAIRRQLSQWGCDVKWARGHERGIQFPPLGALREAFDKRYGRQDWSNATEWVYTPPTDEPRSRRRAQQGDDRDDPDIPF